MVLQPNTDYELKFTYETGLTGYHEIAVLRPDGTKVCSQVLEATELNEEGRTVTLSFNTGDTEGCYLALLYLKDIQNAPAEGEKPEGSYMEYAYLSLDDVSIREMEKDPSEVIASLETVQVQTIQEVAPQLPETVNAVYEDGHTAPVAVEWDEIPADRYVQEGTFTVEGSVQGTSLRAVCEVTVLPRTVVVDKEELRELVEYARARQQEEDYQWVIASVKEKLEAALEQADALLAQESPSEQELTACYNALLDAVHSLSMTGNKTALQEFYDRTADEKQDGATDEAWQAWQQERERAKAVLEDANALQDVIDQQLSDLQAAFDAMQASRPQPTAEPTAEPTAQPTAKPTAEPTAQPTAQPTDEPTVQPTAEPVLPPTGEAPVYSFLLLAGLSCLTAAVILVRRRRSF